MVCTLLQGLKKMMVYLISSFGQDRISQVSANGQSEEVFLAQYNYRLLSPGFYSLARRIYLGATVNF